MAALERGWIPRGDFRDDAIMNACHKEDNGVYKCSLKKGQLPKNIYGALAYIFGSQNLTNTPEAKQIMNLTGSELETVADGVIGDYFQEFRANGVTCDFGGIAQLLEENRTFSDDDSFGSYGLFDDDEYYTIVNKGPPVSIPGSIFDLSSNIFWYRYRYGLLSQEVF